MKWSLFVTALASSGATILAMAGLQMTNIRSTVKLENAKVTVREMIYDPGVPRNRSVRPTDEIIVFMDDCRYRRIDSQTHQVTVRERKSGDVIWHNKGEDAPVLVNLGSKPYRTVLIELKQP